MSEVSIPSYWKRIRESICADPWPLLFWCAALVLLFFALGYRALWGSEGRWAEIVREMMLSNDYFHPTINWAPYFDKPLFTYWVIVATAKVTGSLNEFTARFPGAVAAIVALYCTVSIGKRLYSRRTGYLAAWILLTSYGFIFWSRTACADVENVAFILLAVLWYWHRREHPGFISYLIFYVICAVGAHFKGLPAAVLPGVICLPDVLRQGRWRSYVSFSHVAAICIGVALYLAPFVYAAYTAKNYGESGLYLVFHENILRFFHAFDHREPPYVYLYYVPMLFLPWAPVVLAGLVHEVRRYRQADEFHKWVLEAIAIIFVIYTLSESRRSYYIMPIMPFCALVAGNFLSEGGSVSWRRPVIKVQFCLIMLVSVLELLAPLWIAVFQKYTGIAPPDGLATAFAITGAVSLAALLLIRKTGAGCVSDRNDDKRVLASVIAGTVILTGGFFCYQQNVLEQYRTEKGFLHRLRQVMGDVAPSQVALSRNTASVVYYLGFDAPVAVLKTPDEVAGFMKQEGVKYLVVQRRMLKRAFSILPDEMKKHPFMAAPLYPGQRRRKLQLLVWKVEGPLVP